MIKNIILAGVIGFSVLTAPISNAGSEAGHCRARMHEMLQSLKLDSAQQEKINAIKQQAKSSMQNSWKQMKALRAQMKTMVTSDKIDEAALDKLISEKATLMSSITKTAVLTKNQIYNILTTEQKQQLQSMMQKADSNKMMHLKACRG